MFKNKLTLFTIAGFKIQADFSWLILAALITWTLATGLFPRNVPGVSTAIYWIMGFIGAVGIFGSIIFHELSHSLAARRFGMEIEGITLWIFGGVAHMEENPPSPRAEFAMAIAGPLSSFVLAGVLLGLRRLSGPGEWSPLFFGGEAGIESPVQGVLWYLGRINLILGIFNLVPAFPLDGGRALRSGLWAGKKDIIWASKVASFIGSGFAFLLIGAGVFFLFSGAFVGGIWWVLIGFFLHSASRNAYQQLLVSRALSGVPIKKFMKKDVITIPPNTTVAALVEDYIYTHHYKLFPVASDGNLEGCVTTGEVKDVDRENWDTTEVGSITHECSKENSVTPETDAAKALGIMKRTGRGRLMVVKNGGLLGIVTLKDLMQYLSMKLDLEPGRLKRRNPDLPGGPEG